MILAEWRHDVPAALKLADSTLRRLEDNDSRFLITEVMGRQLSYAGRSEEAIGWLGRARALEVAGHTLWRRNVLITLAEEAGKSDASLAVKYTAEALEVSRKDLNHDRVIEALAEHAIALWKAGQRDDAFRNMEIAVRDLLAGESESIDWKKLLLAVFHTVVYFSSLAHFGSTSGIVGFVPPTQGRFLALDAVDATKFNPAQKSLIRMRMAMLAEGLGKVKSAGEWSDEALKIAASIPDAQTIYSLAWLSIAPALLEAAYGRAVAAALIMANAAVPETDALGRIGISDSENQSRVQQLYQHPAKAASAMLFLAVPLAFQLSTLKLRQSDIMAAVDQVAATLPGDVPYTVLNGALQAVFNENIAWQELKRRSDELMSKVNDSGSAFIYLVGASTQCPLRQTVYLHVWLAREVEKLFAINRSVRLKLIYPFFEGFWMNALDASPHQFRTAEAYTRRAVESAGATQSGKGVRALLNSMAFCLGVNLPDDMQEWLTQADQAERQTR